MGWICCAISSTACAAPKGDYSVDDYLRTQLDAVRKQVGGGEVLLGLSGGVDSSVCAALLSRAIPGRVTCIFVDHGLMRKHEGDEIERAFSGMDMRFLRVNAQERFLRLLQGVREPEEKRRRIGAEFVRVFEQEAAAFRGIRFLAQGTIYPDIIESGTATPRPSRATIMSAACRSKWLLRA